MRERILLAWSGGKDSAMALYELRKAPDLEVVALLTTVTGDYDRISMHGVRRALLARQAVALGLPVEQVIVTRNATNEEYERKMGEMLERQQLLGVTAVAFGDIFLADLRRYREDRLAPAGMRGLFPLWQGDTTELARTFIDEGFKAVITCVDTRALDGRFVGRSYDARFLADLPPNVDPCGENGEFHSFVTNGPIFRHAIRYRKGRIVLRDGRFSYCDLLPV